MAQDAEMTDAVPGAEVDGQPKFEKQKLRLVCDTLRHALKGRNR